MSEPRVHIVEPLGQGGVYQHSVAVAELLATAGQRVVLHTGTDRELDAGAGVENCYCVSWARSARPAFLRRAVVLWNYLGALTHILRALKPGDALHFQGGYRGPLTLMTLLAAKLRGVRVIFSPHNTFERHGRRLASVCLMASMRAAEATVVFSLPDVKRVADLGGRPHYTPLVMHTDRPTAGEVADWRRHWQAEGRKVVLFAGQIRSDKRLDLVILSSVNWMTADVVLAVVGEDKGAYAAARQIADDLAVPVIWDIGYLPLRQFLAAVAAADVVACPYDLASQSAVLETARHLGVTSVATDIGGLADIADVCVPVGDVDGLGTAIATVLRAGGGPRKHHKEAVTQAQFYQRLYYPPFPGRSGG